MMKDASFMGESSHDLTGVASNFVELGGVRLHYLERGRGPLLLMLHGFPEFSGIWGRYLKELSDEYHVVAPDLRGYNLSDKPERVEDYALDALMGDITGLVQALGHDKAYLVGHDWGGILAWYLADLHPELFSKVAIMNAPHPAVYQRLYSEDADQMRRATYVDKLLMPGSDTLLSMVSFAPLKAAIFETSSHRFSDGEKRDYEAVWQRGLKGQINYYRHYFPRMEEYVARLGGVKIPSLVLWGELDDALSIHNLEGLGEHVETLRIVRYPKATHWLTYEIPDLLVAELRAFFR